MTYKSIAYFTEDRIPLSLDKLHYNRFYNKTDVFLAVSEAQNYEELFTKLKRILSSEITVKQSTERFILFSTDGNNLKFRMKRIENS